MTTETKKIAIIYIHGAGGSHRSFAFYAERFPEHKSLFLSYTVDEPLMIVAKRFNAMFDLIHPGHDLVLLGHSLGGVIAHAAHEHPRVKRVVTICAPFGGSAAAYIYRWMSTNTLFENMRPDGPVLREIRSKKPSVPMFSIIGTEGMPLFKEPNDGVVTVSSQTALDGAIYKHVPVNHYEVLLDDTVVSTVSKFIFTGAVG